MQEGGYYRRTPDREGGLLRFVALTALCAALVVVPMVHAADPTLDTDEQKTIYSIGLALSRNLAPFNLTPAELDTVMAGLKDGLFAKEKKVDLEKFGPKIQELAQNRAKAAAEVEKKASQSFIDKAAAEKGAKKTASGAIYQETKAGTGEAPKPTDKVKVHYHGTLTDGTVFDSSRDRGQPATFPLNGVIKCWTEGVGMMKVGGTAKLICPSDTAYGDRGSPPKIKPGATLVFDVELLEIVKDAPKPPTPPAGAPTPGATPPTTVPPKK
jgi:FKBP-type peptidyl-prolyl cis-trans isomerase